MYVYSNSCLDFVLLITPQLGKVLFVLFFHKDNLFLYLFFSCYKRKKYPNDN